jgi:hypothetical protein
MIAPDIEPEVLAQILSCLQDGKEVGLLYRNGRYTVRIDGAVVGGREFQSRSLATAMADGLGIERRMRLCAGPCGQVLDLADDFPRLPGPKHPGGNGGFNRYCRKCENARVREYEQRKKHGLPIKKRAQPDVLEGRPHVSPGPWQ